MKKNTLKKIFILLSVLGSLYFLFPTYKDYTLSSALKPLHGEDSLKFVDERESEIREARAKRIKLGLDLQGGMRVVLEVNVAKLLDDVAKNKDENFQALMNDVRSSITTGEENLIDILRQKARDRGLRLSRYYGNIRDTDDEVLTKLGEETQGAVDRAMEIIRNRVDQYGVSEPSIQKQGSRRIVVELPGVSKESEVRDLIGKTALLEFKLLADPEIAGKVYETIDKVLAGKPITDTAAPGDTTAKADTAAAMTAQADSATAADTALMQLPSGDASAEEQARREHPFFALAGTSGSEQGWNGELYSTDENRPKVTRILVRPEIRKLVPSDMDFVWSAKGALAEGGQRVYVLYAVKKNAELTGGVITEARANIDPMYSAPIVEMEMNSDGAKDWARITGANVQKRIAIILDNACYSAPVVQNKITGGRSQITGMDDMDEARNLAIVLRAGALPAPVEIVQQTNVGPSLGEDSIRSGVWSSLLALGLTILFMIFYYRLGGSVADVALLLNLLFTLAVLAGFGGTLTLPGIAGIILTMAVAVDANVLIYERVREESLTGKTLAAALDAGYSKAFSAIFDSNLTTFITGIILYQFGSGPVQGFALTLMIGIVASMFSSIIITRVIFESMMKRGSKISFG